MMCTRSHTRRPHSDAFKFSVYWLLNSFRIMTAHEQRAGWWWYALVRDTAQLEHAAVYFQVRNKSFQSNHTSLVLLPR